MAKVTSKLQVTIPVALARRYRIAPGDEVQWSAAGDGIRMLPEKRAEARTDVGFRLELFDKATERQLSRQADAQVRKAQENRGWTRDDLYEERVRAR